jgi:hypothetical protein
MTDLDKSIHQGLRRLVDTMPVAPSLEEIKASPQRDNPQFRDTRMHRRPALLGVAVAFVLVAGLTGWLLGNGPGAKTAVSAATVLKQAEDVATISTADTLVPGLYLYERTDSVESVYTASNGHSWTYQLPHTEEVWLAADGSGRERLTPGTPTFPTSTDQAAWTAAGSPALTEFAPSASDMTYPTLPSPVATGPTNSFGQQLQAAATIAAGNSAGLVVFPYDQISGLPTSPAALESTLVSTYEGGRANSQTTFALAASLLEEAPSPALRVALFQMIGTLPGVSASGSSEVGGVSGTGLSLTSDRDAVTIVIDPSTAAVLEVTNQYLGSSASLTTGGSALLGETTIFTQGQVVSSISST